MIKSFLDSIPRGFGRPGRTQKWTAPLHWTWARATSSLRATPDFIIIGAQKAGTTSLCSYLFQHPQVAPARQKEIHFFDEPVYENGPGWYKAHFPYPKEGMITGEASPYYLCHPHAPRRIHELAPDAKLIVMLRNPVDRALSHYNHQIRHGREPLSFEEAIEAEEERLAGEFERMLEDESYYSYNNWAYSYVSRGKYAEQLKCWFDYYPKEQFLFLQSEAFFADPERGHMETLDFLNLDRMPLDHYEKQNTGSYNDMDPRTRDRLTALFHDSNRELALLLQRCFDWH